MKPERLFLIVIFLCLTGLFAQAHNLNGALARHRPDAPYYRVNALRQLATLPADLRAVEPLMRHGKHWQNPHRR